MSCATQSSQPIRLTVTVGNLPEGYCPANFQQFATDFAARLIVTPNQNNSTFVTGSVEPTSNVGPWLKNCLEWFVFDDATGRYVPTRKGGFDTAEYFTSNGTFIVPDFIYKLKVQIWGGGGGGASFSGGVQGAGGGAGGYCMAIFTVAPGQAIPLVIGAGGAGGGSPAGSGGTTTFLTMSAGGGTGGTTSGATSTGGNGGTATGGLINIRGQGGQSPTTGNVTDGAGGSASLGGTGGVLSPTQANANGQVPGGGGCGEVTGTAPVGLVGNGAGGSILIEY
jgi:hypothetical protein